MGKKGHNMPSWIWQDSLVVKLPSCNIVTAKKLGVQLLTTAPQNLDIVIFGYPNGAWEEKVKNGLYDDRFSTDLFLQLVQFILNKC